MYAHVPNATEEDPALLNVQAADDLQDQGFGVHVRVGRGRIEDFLLFHEPIVEHCPGGQEGFLCTVFGCADEVAEGQQIAGRDEPPHPVALFAYLFHKMHCLDPSMPTRA